MTTTEELDRIWISGLARLAVATVEPAPRPESRDRRRRGARARLLVGVGAVAVVLAGGAVIASSRGSSHPLAVRAAPSSTTSASAPTVVDVVDAAGGQLKLEFPGRVASGQPLHVELPAGLIEFRIDERSPGHQLRIEGVDDFAPTPYAPGLVTRTVRLQPGIYRLYCAIVGHAEAGEEMLLDVR